MSILHLARRRKNNSHHIIYEKTSSYFLKKSGTAAIKECAVLSNKFQFLTINTENNVSIYDVLKSSKEDMGAIDFQKEFERRNRFESEMIPNWFKVNSTLGVCTNQ